MFAKRGLLQTICAATVGIVAAQEALSQFGTPFGGPFQVPAPMQVPVEFTPQGLGTGLNTSGPSWEDRLDEIQNGYHGADIVRIEPDYPDPGTAQVRANQLLREISNPIANVQFSNVDHGIKVYYVASPYNGIAVPRWLAYARAKVVYGNGGENNIQGPLRAFQTECGASLKHQGANRYVLIYDNGGPAVPFDLVGKRDGVETFRYVGNVMPPFGIHTLVVSNGYIGKIYEGQDAPVYHAGWNGRWMPIGRSDMQLSRNPLIIACP
jgi:hypothetical protein